MKKVVIVGTGNLSFAVAELLNPLEMKLVAFGDTREEAWNIFSENGDLKDELEDLPVMPVDLAIALEPDIVVIASTDPQISHNLRYMIIRAGYENDILFIGELCEQFSVGGASLRRLSRRLNSLGVPGAVAELGAYRGDVSWQLNVLFPDRKLYLFDTFEGFDARDIAKEKELACSGAQAGAFSPVNTEDVLARMPHGENVVLKKGWFPETALDMEDEAFALAYLDALLYHPTLAGLEFFFPRMSKGGVIVLRGMEDDAYRGVARAVEDLEAKFGALLLMPLGDLRGTALIVHP